MIFLKSNRIKAVEQRVKRIEEIIPNLIAKVNDFRNQYALAIDKKYEFSEILECLDDIMLYIDNHP